MVENKGYSKNVELIAYHKLNRVDTGFQMALQRANDRSYLYLAGWFFSGFHIVDVTEPAKPKYIQFFKGPQAPDQPSKTWKIQVADGKLISSLQQGVEGIAIYDVEQDPENPKFLSQWSTGDPTGSTHRNFYNGGRYVHLSSKCPGFDRNIYRIVDIIDPKNPVEVGKWWLPEQYLLGVKQEERETIRRRRAGLHGPPYVKGNLVYCSWGSAGMQILDISDITQPKLVGQLRHNPPFAGGRCGAWCHTIVPLSQQPYAVMTSEGERFPLLNKAVIGGKPQPLALFGMVDVSDPSDPTLVSTFPYPEVPPGFPYPNFEDCGLGCQGPFGPHNLHEPHDHPDLEDRNDRIYCCYFHAGLRIYDISDPFVPKEIAYYIPPNPTKWIHGEYTLAEDDPTFSLFAWPRGPMIATTEDVLVDKRGYIFMDTFHDGLYVLRCTV